jgi:DNA-directed RNA polymerase beta' subunit
MEEINEVDTIVFGIFSPQEILNLSVCKITSSKNEGRGTVYDPRMGASSNVKNNLPCETCGKRAIECPGHFGHIELNEYIIHPLFYKYVVQFLRCFCLQCNRLLITADQMAIDGLLKYKKERRFKKLLEKLEKVGVCCRCGDPHPWITYSTTDNTINKSYREKVWMNKDNDLKTKKKITHLGKIIIQLSVDEIKKIFDSIKDEDVILCGFDPTRIHPRNLILQYFPVIPPAARPFVLTDGNTCDDDLTNQLMEIIKANNILKPDPLEKPIDEKKETRRQKALNTLKFRISTFYNNSQQKAKHPTNGEL